MGGADEVMGQWLVHLLVELQPVQENRCVFIRHQISAKSITGHPTWMEKQFVLNRTGPVNVHLMGWLNMRIQNETTNYELIYLLISVQ